MEAIDLHSMALARIDLCLLHFANQARLHAGHLFV
jgi:hypothetical protein